MARCEPIDVDGQKALTQNQTQTQSSCPSPKGIYTLEPESVRNKNFGAGDDFKDLSKGSKSASRFSLCDGLIYSRYTFRFGRLVDLVGNVDIVACRSWKKVSS